jgi:hypothetical protein
MNTLKTWDAAHGYWIKTITTTQAAAIAGVAQEQDETVATLRLVGQTVPVDRPLPLAAGWNLVSYLPQTALPVTVALQSIAGQYTVVQGFDHGAQSFYPDLDPIFNTLQTMRPGLGYWIRATQAVTLTYPVTDTVQVLGIGYSVPIGPNTQYPISDIRQVEADAGIRPTNAWVDFYGPAVGSGVQLLNQQGAALPVGAVVKAVDPQGVVCGATVVTTEGQYGLLACYGDDPDTPADEGAVVGDRVRLMVGGEVLGIGYWVGRGERQWVALGKINLWRQFFPAVGQGATDVPAAEQPAPESQPPMKQWLPFVGGARSETGASGKDTGAGGSQPAGAPTPAPASPEPLLTPTPTRGVQRPARRRMKMSC